MDSGFLLINKPSGPTSHDAIYTLRKILGIKKIGHAGTLDPFAEGLLLIGIGDATKLLRHYVGLDKMYEATLKLGATSDTQDRTGKIQETKYKQDTTTKSKIENVLKSFIGKQKQTPPMHSAKKIDGVRLYKLARQGKEVERKAVEIEIYSINLISFDKDILKIQCRVSSGTFIRTLAEDIGKKLGCGAYLEELTRTHIGKFDLKDSVDISQASVTGSLVSARDDIVHHITPLKTVLASGTFDGIHPGHIHYFQQARALGQRLICIVGRDSVVEKIKGKKPKLSEKERIKLVKLCEEIDRVFLGIHGSDAEVYDFVASLKPDIIALGYDQKAYTNGLKEEMKARGLSIEVKRLVSFNPKRFKSSIIDVGRGK
ncbi:tRNA pseudouridine(55) synthase TruB [bacterium CG10_46_32]|nr:MAG: tRNA pseudouridine(55) synthase TruB [bacterium CG10_46_32]PIR55911.1 MAG: tRNA pseudouridine(55) synthase TruB [Parcubacteria group bacterium CG10_big_fil_rev_8_21_14_0_10_46_32]